MRLSELLQGIREMRFIEVHARYERAELSQLEAAALLGVSERTFRRCCGRYDAEGGLEQTEMVQAA